MARTTDTETRAIPTGRAINILRALVVKPRLGCGKALSFTHVALDTHMLQVFECEKLTKLAESNIAILCKCHRILATSQTHGFCAHGNLK
jgi:hypothetical protein